MVSNIDQKLDKLTHNPFILAIILLGFVGLLYGYIMLLFTVMGG